MSIPPSMVEANSLIHCRRFLPMLRITSIRLRAYLAITLGLGLAYLLAALALARSSEVADFGWPSRFDIWSGLVIVLLALYGGAWLLGRQTTTSRPRPPHDGWQDVVRGVLCLLALVVLVGVWNVAQDASHFAHFPGTTAAEFCGYVGDSCYDYIVKPLVYIMPLGSLVAGPLGWWVGRRAAKSPA